ncbi:MAG: hypothetical protein HYY40_00650 [Bacteroidetes bacterium]|nr:hypothetical protein [Bacteroidota bacterium]
MDEINSHNRHPVNLPAGEKASNADLRKLIGETCHYAKNIVVSNDEHGDPVALIFPDKKLLSEPDYLVTPGEGCFCPRNVDELGRCLTGCLKLVNQKTGDDFLKIKSAVIMNSELSNDGERENVRDFIIEKYKTLLDKKSKNHFPAGEEIYFIKID